jgi:flagellar biosynthesis GTPase FlhF
MEQDRQRILDILDYWHKIEFFIPFGLDQKISDNEEWQTRTLSAVTLAQSSDDAWRTLFPPPPLKVTGYNLYLGVFDRSALTQVSERHLTAHSQPHHFNVFEEEERTELEGKTCFARISLDANGVALLPDVSVSAAPWALGTIANTGLDGLTFDAFEAAKKDLGARLENFVSECRPDPDPGLRAEHVLRLHEILCDWAGFRPGNDQPVAILEVLAREPSAKKDNASKATGAEPSADAHSVDSVANADKTPEGVEGETDDEEDLEPQIDILNSFYIKDIEHAINSVRNGHMPQTLRQYLTPLEPSGRVDLFSEKGQQAIYDALLPQRINIGHWLADAEKAMSQRQQFAINTVLQELQSTGLFSVNGPPGTGKTTLLRDLFAENIVQRARVLSTLATAQDAFEKGSVAVSFPASNKTTHIRKLIPALTGFEMVVASTNNAAVENISVDLPKRKELGREWKNATYLQPIAHHLALTAEKGQIKSPQADDMPWGLISCALGNSKNRRKFCDRVLGYESLKTSHAETPLMLKDWLNGEHSASFAEAAAEFRQMDEKVCAALALRSRLAELVTLFSQTRHETYHAPQQQALETAQARLKDIQTAITETNGLLGVRKNELDELREDERLIERKRPGWLARLFNNAACKRYTAEKVSNAHQQQQMRVSIRSLSESLTPKQQKQRDAESQLATSQAALQARQASWRTLVTEYEGLTHAIGECVVPSSLRELEEDSFQIKGLWHDDAMDSLRSQLFAAALNLQQAWLAETGKKGGGFAGNIFALGQLLRNYRPGKQEHVLPIWQSLFMIVPVVSTTFASFANQFHGLGEGSLGWLYIDEAGQAVPQAAVGALLRAKRAVVVGDPLQIEPVFTLPSRLITALSGLSTHTADEQYAPHMTSVQSLADRANVYGTYSDGENDAPLWIGSPLRVHRRCVDPMYSLSNAIAYNRKMVFGLPSRTADHAAPVHCDSCWIDLPGLTRHKQVVPQQIDFMVGLVVRLYQHTGALPELFIISPFKAIRLELQKVLRKANWAGGTFKEPPTGTLKAWIKHNVGTVHTFQGKEKDTVFMVLGVDAQSAGAAQWASSKPNLLNVALTRAKRRFYMVGDHALWSSLPYFSSTQMGATKLPLTTAAAFLADLAKQEGNTSC